MIKTINLNTGEGYKKTVYPDSQPHVYVEVAPEEYMVRVIVSLDSPQKLLELCLVANALDNDRTIAKSELHITYLMAARSDRIHDLPKGHSFDLEVVANIINSLEFLDVYLYDPHSDVAAGLIKRAYVVTNQELVEAYDKEDAVLIIPDAGAAKKAHRYAEWNPKIKDPVHCIKHRDLSTGKISLEVLTPERCAGRHCVIIDDICDGGGTFLMIAAQLRNQGWNPASMTLIVTHGIFSKGFGDLAQYFDQIICSDSFGKVWTNILEREYPNLKLKQIAYDAEKYGISV